MCEAGEAGDRETFPRWLSSHMMMHRRTDQRTLTAQRRWRSAQNGSTALRLQHKLGAMVDQTNHLLSRIQKYACLKHTYQLNRI